MLLTQDGPSGKLFLLFVISGGFPCGLAPLGLSLRLCSSHWSRSSGCSLRPLLTDVTLAPDVISPNADGQDDVTLIRYRTGRAADVSIYLIDAAGQRFFFRDSERRSPGRYNVYWGGVITDPQVREIDGGTLLVESQVLPDGAYTWVVEAVNDSGRSQKVEGQITLHDADTALPEMHNFTVVPQDFTPNQDSIHDRVSISYYLTKQAERVQVYLEPATTEAGQPKLKYPIAEIQPARPPWWARLAIMATITMAEST